MELEKFGEEVVIDLAKNTNTNPLTICLRAPSRLSYSGPLDTWSVLQQQLVIVQRRMAKCIAEQLGAWASNRAKAGYICSKRVGDAQTLVGNFGEHTSIRATSYAGGLIQVCIWLPAGIIVQPSKQIEVLNAEFAKLRSRLVTEFKAACDAYANSVDIAASEITLSDLGLDAEITIK